jgi:hypothetical protein
MRSLSETWFADGYIDFELKKYTLLAYLKEVNAYFTENKLYPQLADVIFHYNNIVCFRENKKFLQEQFPKKLTGIQIEKLQLLYEQMIEDDEMMNELEEIINFASGKMHSTITNGTEIYEFVEENISIAPIGIIPLALEEGYLFVGKECDKATHVYQYRLSIFERHDEKYRALKTEFISSWQRNMVNTYQNIKAELIRNRSQLPNPAVYSIETTLDFPLNETLLPVAKRMFTRFLTDQSNAA